MSGINPGHEVRWSLRPFLPSSPALPAETYVRVFRGHLYRLYLRGARFKRGPLAVHLRLQCVYNRPLVCRSLIRQLYRL